MTHLLTVTLGLLIIGTAVIALFALFTLISVVMKLIDRMR